MNKIQTGGGCCKKNSRGALRAPANISSPCKITSATYELRSSSALILLSLVYIAATLFLQGRVFGAKSPLFLSHSSETAPFYFFLCNQHVGFELLCLESTFFESQIDGYYNEFVWIVWVT